MKNGNYYLIIQHNQAFSSVYANLRNLQVNPGKRVAAGQLIATLGTDTLNRPVLYFEIRCWDKAINSLDYLPKE
jgi:septal ring factor EnvC (AmiA/AmiB activator)